MKHLHPHGLDRQAALALVRSALRYYEKRYAAFGPRVDWADEHRASVSFTVAGLRIAGEIAVTDQAIEIDVNPPLVFRAFRRRAIAAVDDVIRGWIARSGPPPS